MIIMIIIIFMIFFKIIIDFNKTFILVVPLATLLVFCWVAWHSTIDRATGSARDMHLKDAYFFVFNCFCGEQKEEGKKERKSYEI